MPLILMVRNQQNPKKTPHSRCTLTSSLSLYPFIHLTIVQHNSLFRRLLILRSKIRFDFVAYTISGADSTILVRVGFFLSSSSGS